jgi:hypothetical protein
MHTTSALFEILRANASRERRDENGNYWRSVLPVEHRPDDMTMREFRRHMRALHRAGLVRYISRDTNRVELRVTV